MPNSKSQNLAKHIVQVYDEFVTEVDANGDTWHTCSSFKYEHVKGGTPIAQLAPSRSSHPLNELLRDLAKLCQQHYATLPPVSTTEVPLGPKANMTRARAAAAKLNPRRNQSAFVDRPVSSEYKHGVIPDGSLNSAALLDCRDSATERSAFGGHSG